MTNQIYPCLWFDGKAKEAAEFYCSIFNNSKINAETPLVVKWELEGTTIMGLNGGPMFTINPSISLFVSCDSAEETERIWNGLIEGGSAMMPLDKYPWSEKYGWLTDKFGMTWQIMQGQQPAGRPKIIPSFLFAGDQYSKAVEAINAWTSIFPNSTAHQLMLYAEGEPQPAGNLKFGHFTLNNTLFAAMDGIGDHKFKFNEAVSLVVECENQEEIDNFWNKLTADGGKESMCGWLSDKFGVNWQIVPKNIGAIMMDPQKGPRAMQEIMKMKKLDIALLENA